MSISPQARDAAAEVNRRRGDATALRIVELAGHGMSKHDLAVALRVSQTSVPSVVSRAKRRLAAVMPDGCQHGEDPTGRERECECPDAVELAEWLEARR